MRSYSDEDLANAISTARSWRGVLRALGLQPTSAGAYRSARRRADRLGFDYTHFTGQRRWTDRDLAGAVAASTTWTEVLPKLGLSPDSSTTAVRGHAVRLGLETSHLQAVRPTDDAPSARTPDVTHLTRGGPLLAATWFTLTGAEVAWPLEPCRYDLLVIREQMSERVQVKTTTVRSGGSFEVNLRCLSSGKKPYDPDEIDPFFIADADLSLYLIPVHVVAGRTAIRLSAYEAFRLRPLALS